jgi:hypothetical protein
MVAVQALTTKDYNESTITGSENRGTEVQREHTSDRFWINYFLLSICSFLLSLHILMPARSLHLKSVFKTYDFIITLEFGDNNYKTDGNQSNLLSMQDPFRNTSRRDQQINDQRKKL